MQEDKPLTPNHPDHPETRSQRGVVRCISEPFGSIWRVCIFLLHGFPMFPYFLPGLERLGTAWDLGTAAVENPRQRLRLLFFGPSARHSQMGRAPPSASFGSQKNFPIAGYRWQIGTLKISRTSRYQWYVESLRAKSGDCTSFCHLGSIFGIRL